MTLTGNNNLIYFMTFITGGLIAAASCPLFRLIALKFNVIDLPNTAVKTHKQATPYLGGCAIVLGFYISLALARHWTEYPTGTLKPIWGIFLGGLMVFALGLVDDIVRGGLSFKTKFFVQFIAATLILFFDIQMNFIHPRWMAFIVTAIWVTGIMNAINIIDIMDGLAAGTSVIALLAFLFISLPTEHIYVNMTAAALAGSVLGFLPFNLSKSHKMFMGDTGSLFLGYVLATLSLGTTYTTFHNAGVLAPILILGVPLYDTFYVMLIRHRKGLSPFLGSKDHFALRLEKLGFSRKSILYIAIGISASLAFCAWLTTWIWFWWAVCVYLALFALAFVLGFWLSRVQVD